MDRRVFLKATGAGLVHPAGLLTVGPALLRQGNRRLKDITIDELMELIAWADIDVESLVTVEEAEQYRGKPIASLHPEYYLEYVEENYRTGPEEKIWFRYWWCDYAEEHPHWEESGGCIMIGTVWGHYGYAIPRPLDVVKWFLGHGFRVW